MIDTIKFKIPLTNATFLDFESYLHNVRKTSNNGTEIEFSVYQKTLQLGSFSHPISLFVPNHSQHFYLEFSVPKITYGHNTILIFKHELLEACNLVHSLISDKIQILPVSLWQVQRLDLCYNWTFPDDTELLDILSVISSIDYRRKQKYIYDTSVMYRGSSYSLKFYLKHPEFLRHDYKRLKKINPKVADYAYLMSKNMLRYEITMRKEYLNKVFGKKFIFISDIIELDIKKQLNDVLSIFTAYINPTNMERNEILNKLSKRFKPNKALRLYTFYSAYYGDDLVLKQQIIKTLSRMQIYRNKRDLASVGVGFSNKNVPKGTKISLHID